MYMSKNINKFSLKMNHKIYLYIPVISLLSLNNELFIKSHNEINKIAGQNTKFRRRYTSIL